MKKTNKQSALKQLLIGLLAIVFLNITGIYLYHRFDLTAEKRYTLSPATIKLLKKVDSRMLFTVYLEGNFPAGFQRLRSETREMLSQFKSVSNRIEYRFIDPVNGKNKAENEALQKQLITLGLTPTDLQVRSKEGYTRKLIFPGATVEYQGREIPVDLLLTQVGRPPEEVLNSSVQALEYSLSNAVSKLIVKEKPKIAFIHGQGELQPVYTAGAEKALSEYYTVEHVQINGQSGALFMPDSASPQTPVNKFKAIIIASPDSAFAKDENDKFLIDQYIMNGGKALWLVDPVYAKMDSLRNARGQTFGIARPLNIEDMLFNYGVRLNPDLVVDMNALSIPVVVDKKGNQQLLPWLFFPLLQPASDNPIVKNLNTVKSEFVSSMDTVETPGISKTVLLSTSRYSRKLNAPVDIKLDYLYRQPDPRQLNQPNQAAAVLLQGSFTSLYQNRVPAYFQQNRPFNYVWKSKPTQIIVVSDGDVIKNQVQPEEMRLSPLPLGFDRYTGQQFGNKDFILNAMNFLCDDSGLLEVRSREVKLRLLDKEKIENGRLKWQLINILSPLFILLAFALLFMVWRKRRYAGGKL